jgi:hypothetical protein
METFNAVMMALILIVLTGTAAIAMFVAACYFILGSKGEEDRFAIIMIFGVPSAVAGVIALWGMINVIYYWLIPAIW